MFRLLNLILTSLFTFILMVLVGCAETDEDKVGSAQYCLDDVPASGLTATDRQTKINSCLSKITNVKTKQASLIRCSGGFLIEGFGDPAILVNALTTMNDSTGGNGTTALMNVLAFKTQGASSTATSDEDKVFAQKTFDYCNEAGNPGFVMFASISNMATVFASIAAKVGSTSIADLINNPASAATLLAESDEIIGATAAAAYQTSCTSGDETNAELCSQLGTAMDSGATAEQIGAALRDGWKSQ